METENPEDLDWLELEGVGALDRNVLPVAVQDADSHDVIMVARSREKHWLRPLEPAGPSSSQRLVTNCVEREKRRENLTRQTTSR